MLKHNVRGIVSLLMAILTIHIVSAGTVTINVDNPENIEIYKNGRFGSKISVFQTIGTTNELTVPAGAVIFAAKTGYELKSIKDDAGADLGSIADNQCTLQIDATFDGRTINVSVVEKGEVQEASAWITVVGDPSKVSLSQNYKTVVLNEGRNELKFDPDNQRERGIIIGSQNSGPRLCNVKRNGEKVWNDPIDSKLWQLQISPDDEIEITVDFPAGDINLKFNLPEGCEDAVTEVLADGIPLTGYLEGCKVRCGAIVKVTYDSEQFNIKDIRINNQKIYEFNKVTVGPEDAVFNLDVARWPVYEVSLDVDDPDNMTVSVGSKNVPLVKGLNRFGVTEKNGGFGVKREKDSYIRSVTDWMGNNVYVDSRVSSGVSSIRFTDSQKTDPAPEKFHYKVESAKIVRQTRIITYLHEDEAYTYSTYIYNRQNERIDTLKKDYGYLMIDPQAELPLDFTFGGWGPDGAYDHYMVLNDMEWAGTSGFNFADLKEDDVLKYYPYIPDVYEVVFKSSVPDKKLVRVITDKVRVRTDWEDGLFLYPGTEVRVNPGQDNVQVKVDGDLITPDENGDCVFRVNKDMSVVMALDPNVGVAQTVCPEETLMNVYNSQGLLVVKGVPESFVESLPAGLYIVGGRKVIKK